MNIRKSEISSFKRQKKSILWLLVKNTVLLKAKGKIKFFIQEDVDVKKLNAIEIIANASKLELVVVTCVNVKHVLIIK